MDYEKVKAGIQEISQIASGVPEAFQEKCFEVLLRALLAGTAGREPGGSEDTNDPPNELRVPPRVRAFMARRGITDEKLMQVVMADGEGGFLFVRKPSGGSLAAAQIEWSLLLALKSALMGGAFSLSGEDVRAVCEDENCYDRRNFATNFKRSSNAMLYKGPVVPGGESQSLSPAGEERLGELILRLSEGA